jgi:hypothetical protein
VSSAIIFVTNKESEANRLIPIVARGNGGIKDFAVETLPSAKPTYAIVYTPTNSKMTNARLACSRAVAIMAGFLTGFVAAEKANQQSIARERRLREQHRLGRR